VLCRVLLRESRNPSLPRTFDVAGAVTITLALVLLVYGITEAPAAGWASPRTWALFAASAALLAAFLVIAVWPVGIVSFALGAPVAVVLPLTFATGIGFALFDVFWNTTMAEQIPPHALSRASAWEWMGSLVLLPVGYLAAGPLADATSAETVLVGGAILTATVLALGLLPRETRTLRRVQQRSRV